MNLGHPGSPFILTNMAQRNLEWLTTILALFRRRRKEKKRKLRPLPEEKRKGTKELQTLIKYHHQAALPTEMLKLHPPNVSY